MSATDRELRHLAISQIRDSLATLSYAADGHYEDEAQVALDALDWLESHCPLDERRAEHLGSAPVSSDHKRTCDPRR